MVSRYFNQLKPVGNKCLEYCQSASLLVPGERPWEIKASHRNLFVLEVRLGGTTCFMQGWTCRFKDCRGWGGGGVCDAMNRPGDLSRKMVVVSILSRRVECRSPRTERGALKIGIHLPSSLPGGCRQRKTEKSSLVLGFRFVRGSNWALEGFWCLGREEEEGLNGTS